MPMKKSGIVLGTVALVAGLYSPAAPAQMGRSNWDTSDFSRVRLLLLPADPSGKLTGGVEIQLEPGWHTYWQVPGDAGVPPRFDFSRSGNVEKVSVKYPLPERYMDGGSVSVIYRDKVVFPLEIEAIDPRKPVELSVDLFYGACSEVCIPVQSEIATAIAPDSKPDPLARIAIAEFQRKLPGPPRPDFSILSAKSDGEQLIIETAHPGFDPVDLFVKGPEDWFTGQPQLVSSSEKGAVFSLSLKGVPADADVSNMFDMLLVSGEEGILAKSVAVGHND